MLYSFHLFAGTFKNEKDAQKFAFEHWEPEPSADTCDSDYEAWERRNPIWPLKQELGFYMDSDFVELVTDLSYLNDLIQSESEKSILAKCLSEKYSHYIIIGSEAIYGDRRAPLNDKQLREPVSTESLVYLGKFNSKIQNN
ncbi:hypothetical protein [Chitinibacter tainanensis]|uniref:hypothetical protein n=1 Tax=Chitinibacter tainanensis TaxID=230667 RepID=UPI000554E10D|nr:hypothetical protein [Chitinibacter tainanensis]